MEDYRAAIAVVGILLIVKIVVGGLLLLFLPIAESASLYAVVHLSALFGIVPLGLILGGSFVFWWRVIRMRARRRRYQWLEWNVDGEPGVASDATPPDAR